MWNFALLVALVLICVPGSDSCLTTDWTPCAPCDEWHEQERLDDSWRQTLNRVLKCPCRVRYFGNTAIPIGVTTKWTTEKECNPGESRCYGNDGAYACIWSTDSNLIGNARQQCCYDSNGNILRPPSRGAGTPDRETEVDAHWEADVGPFQLCCERCDLENGCDKFKGLDGVRTGDTSHCP